jgi:hypothetical protein
MVVKEVMMITVKEGILVAVNCGGGGDDNGFRNYGGQTAVKLWTYEGQKFWWKKIWQFLWWWL